MSNLWIIKKVAAQLTDIRQNQYYRIKPMLRCKELRWHESFVMAGKNSVVISLHDIEHRTCHCYPMLICLVVIWWDSSAPLTTVLSNQKSLASECDSFWDFHKVQVWKSLQKTNKTARTIYTRTQSFQTRAGFRGVSHARSVITCKDARYVMHQGTRTQVHTRTHTWVHHITLTTKTHDMQHFPLNNPLKYWIT